MWPNRGSETTLNYHRSCHPVFIIHETNIIIVIPHSITTEIIHEVNSTIVKPYSITIRVIHEARSMVVRPYSMTTEAKILFSFHRSCHVHNHVNKLELKYYHNSYHNIIDSCHKPCKSINAHNNISSNSSHETSLPYLIITKHFTSTIHPNIIT